MTLIAIGLLVFGPMLIEAARASTNERRQLARGGVEAADDAFQTMRIVYPASFLAMLAEGAVRGIAPQQWTVAAGALVFVAAKAIKWAAILALGRAWTFRVIVVPGDARIAAGPYRYVRHPNYLGVVGEFVGVALMTRAAFTGVACTIVFGTLLARRIAVEEQMLASWAPGPHSRLQDL
jgi:methyltransferase